MMKNIVLFLLCGKIEKYSHWSIILGLTRIINDYSEESRWPNSFGEHILYMSFLSEKHRNCCAASIKKRAKSRMKLSVFGATTNTASQFKKWSTNPSKIIDGQHQLFWKTRHKQKSHDDELRGSCSVPERSFMQSRFPTLHRTGWGERERVRKETHSLFRFRWVNWTIVGLFEGNWWDVCIGELLGLGELVGLYPNSIPTYPNISPKSNTKKRNRPYADPSFFLFFCLRKKGEGEKGLPLCGGWTYPSKSLIINPTIS